MDARSISPDLVAAVSRTTGGMSVRGSGFGGSFAHRRPFLTMRLEDLRVDRTHGAKARARPAKSVLIRPRGLLLLAMGGGPSWSEPARRLRGDQVRARKPGFGVPLKLGVDVKDDPANPSPARVACE